MEHTFTKGRGMKKAPRDTSFDALIPELPTWNEGNGIDVGSWLSCVGTYEHAAAYAHLFWPPFTIHDDCVLFADFDEGNFAAWIAHTKGDKKAVEGVMNHRHVLDLFPSAAADPSRALVAHLGRQLEAMWTCKLQRDFPARTIVVRLTELDGEDMVDCQVTFFQEHGRGDPGGDA